MKFFRRAFCFGLILAIVCGLFCGTVFADESQEYVFAVNQTLSNTPVSVEVNVPAGDYTLTAVYRSLDTKISAHSLTVTVNGDEPFAAALPKFWTANGTCRVDGQGNEFAPEQVLYEDESTYTLTETVDYVSGEKVFALPEGQSTVVFTPISCNLTLSAVVLSAPVAVPKTPTNASAESRYKGDPITVEGENASLKNNYWLIAASDSGSINVTPSDPVKAKINYIGGATWKKIGDTIYWTVNAPEAGYYALNFSYRQGFVMNGNTYRSLRVNGKVPFAAAESIAFPYTSGWKKMTFATDSGKTYPIYLDAGENEISLTVTMGRSAEVCSLMEKVVDEMGQLYLEINMVTGDTVDIYRDYRLFSQIPDFNKRLKSFYKQLDVIDRKLIADSKGEANSYSSSVKNMMEIINLMYGNPYSAHRYKSTYYNNYSALSACLNDMQDMPLDIDSLTFSAIGYQVETSFGEKIGNFFRSVGYSCRRFVASFTEDYNNISGTNTTDSITVWVNWGRDQAQVLNQLIQSTFTAKHDIGVNVKISNASIVQGVLSGNGPDVILQQARTEPVNLAMRGVLADLSQFDDCEETLSRFQAGAELPYRYQNGLYALPDSQSFLMLFYREDVLEQLGIDPASLSTWDGFKTASRILARNNFKAWLPYTQITDMNLVNTGVGNLNIFPTLLLQNGIDLYNEDHTATNLTTTESITVFSDWAECYTKMKLPYQLDFYNRFRIGTCPIGISSYALYNTLKDAAKEIDGKWQMAELPGVVGEDGTLRNTSAGAGTGCAILSACKNPDAAWEFLKWWTSAEVQLAYSNSLESILGPIGRMAVANVEAFKLMAWDTKMEDNMLVAWEHTTELPEVPGSYYVARSIDFAFWNTANENENAKDQIVTWGEEANAEIARKLAQYENR